MADRDEFLASIRHRTLAGRYRPTVAPDSAWTPREKLQNAPPMGDLAARFSQEIEALGGHCHRASDLAGARQYILSLARERRAQLLVRWDLEELKELGIDDAPKEASVEVAVWRDLENFREVASAADIGLTTADWAVAETGSVVLSSGRGRGRSVALLPPTHVALLPVGKVLPTVSDVLERYAERGTLPDNVSFHTGPSRSGDLEQVPVYGVHGPGDVHAVVVG